MSQIWLCPSWFSQAKCKSGSSTPFQMLVVMEVYWDRVRFIHASAVQPLSYSSTALFIQFIQSLDTFRPFTASFLIYKRSFASLSFLLISRGTHHYPPQLHLPPTPTPRTTRGLKTRWGRFRCLTAEHAARICFSLSQVVIRVWVRARTLLINHVNRIFLCQSLFYLKCNCLVSARNSRISGC